MLNKSPSFPESLVAFIYCIKHLNITIIDYDFKKSPFQLKRSLEDDFPNFMCYYKILVPYPLPTPNGNSCLQIASKVENRLGLLSSPHFTDTESIIWRRT